MAEVIFPLHLQVYRLAIINIVRIWISHNKALRSNGQRNLFPQEIRSDFGKIGAAMFTNLHLSPIVAQIQY